MHLDEVQGLFEFTRAGFEALGLEFTEEVEGLFELAGEALAVDAEIGEGLGLGFEGGGDGEGLLDLFWSLVERVRLADDAEGEEIVFKGADAVLPPGRIGQGLDELGFGGALGVVFGGEGLDVALVGFEIVGGEDDDLSG